MNVLEERLQAELQGLEQQGLLRGLKPVDRIAGGRIRSGESRLLNLAGNDYLGIGSNQTLLDEFYSTLSADDRLGSYNPGSGSSRLMTGNHSGYEQLEQGLASLYGTEKALVFNSGYHCNVGLLPALAGKEDLILADKLCHASLIDGMRLSRARLIRYPHADYERLEGLLRKHTPSFRTVFIVTESIFSMDGDCADLSVLTELKQHYNAVLYLDEAHAVGVRGRQGRGLAEEQGKGAEVDLLVGTFGKAWAGQGAFVACSRILYDYLVNRVRSLIFTTGLPPVSIHWLDFLLPQIKEMERERHRLAELAHQLRQGLRGQGLVTGGNSQIVPVMIGDAARAVAAAGRLRSSGFQVNAVRPPTVPEGTSRLRLTLTAAMETEQLSALPALIARAIT